ncbi:hypothetical protein [Hymenobacter nivis]|nr:hypothetical protein [Hymenobacter nivis]
MSHFDDYARRAWSPALLLLLLAGCNGTPTATVATAPVATT